MAVRKIHYVSGIIISIFIGLHLFNHLSSIFGADKHIEIMSHLRRVYRNIFAEALLLTAILAQIVSGISLFRTNRKIASTASGKLQVRTGLYLSLFFVVHISVVFAGRFLWRLDTNFYFGVAGLNSFPANLFFVPYYGLAVVSFFGHIASVHYRKMKQTVLYLTPGGQSILILILGICLSMIILYGLTNRFQGFEIPAAYRVPIGEP